MKYFSHSMAALALIACTGAAFATEGGGSTYPSGVENYLVGAVPPPGFYVLGFGNVYSANQLKDNNGDDIPIPGFKVRAVAAVTRLVWSTPHPMLGGNLVMHSILPLVDLDVAAAGASQHKTGLGDITVGAGIAYHHSPQLHTAIGVDLVLPTGGYNKADLANIGRNYVSIQPLYALSYIDPTGFNGDFKLTFNLNQKNEATQYQSGDEVFLDYSAGYGLGNGWTVGVGGFLRQQFSDDKLNGATVANSRASAFGIGPSIKYDNGKGWFITAKLQAESSAKNTTQGTALWIKTLIPF